MITASPAVSVVMAVHNGAAHLEQSLHSLTSQTFTDFETIVVNDGSTDLTAQVLSTACRLDSRIRVINQPRSGLASALNVGIASSRALLVARQDADDISAPNRLERQIAFMRSHPAVGVVGTSTVAIDANGATVRQLTTPVGPAPVKTALLTLRATPVHGSVMFRRQAVVDTGGYRPGFLAAQDLDLWLRMAERCELDNLPDTLYSWRLHSDGVFATKRATQLMYAGVARTFADERKMSGSDSYAALQGADSLTAFATNYHLRGRLEARWGELLFRGLNDPTVARPHLRAALAAGQINPRTLALYGWSLLGGHWPGGPTLQPPPVRT